MTDEHNAQVEPNVRVTDEMVDAYKAVYSKRVADWLEGNNEFPGHDFSREATRAGLEAALSSAPVPDGKVEPVGEIPLDISTMAGIIADEKDGFMSLKLRIAIALLAERQRATQQHDRDAAKPVEHIWVRCPNGHGSVTHQHFDVCGCCPECGAVMTLASPPARHSDEEVERPRRDHSAFKPCVIHYAYGDYSQMLLEDRTTIVGLPVVVEPLYRMLAKKSDREIIGFQWPGREPAAIDLDKVRRETWEEAAKIAEDYGHGAMPDSDYRLACNDLFEALHARAALQPNTKGTSE